MMSEDKVAYRAWTGTDEKVYRRNAYCGNCRFWSILSGVQGVCRRYPSEIPKDAWEWCGECEIGKPDKPEPVTGEIDQSIT